MRHNINGETRLLQTIAAGEDSVLELKEVRCRGRKMISPSRDVLADELAAFANAQGGTLILGVEDASREIVGIPLDVLDSAESTVTQVAHGSIDPPLSITTEKLALPSVGGTPRWILRVDVDRSASVHRSPQGYLWRQGSSKRVVSHDQLVRLIYQKDHRRRVRFDETAVRGTTEGDLDPGLTGRFRTLRTSDSDAMLARKLGMAASGESGGTRLTVAGVLMGTKRPERWLPQAFVQAVAYRADSISGAMEHRNYQLDARDIYGPLDSQVAKARRFVAQNQRVAARKTLGRKDMPQFDMTAVFEAVVNAIAHRDYSVAASKIRLRMFRNRLELYCPGTLANTITLESLPYRQATRNEAVTSLLAKCRIPESIPGLRTTRVTLMDRRGEGVPVILERSERLSGRMPVYRLIDGAELQLTIHAASAD